MKKNPAFDAKKYEKAQTKAIRERFKKFPKGNFYFEIGGKFLLDRHAASVLPGFPAKVKQKIVKKVARKIDLIFCISAVDTENNRIWKRGETYQESTLSELRKLRRAGFKRPKIAVNLYRKQKEADKFIRKLERIGYSVYKRRYIKGYPKDIDKIVSPKGYGKDDYIPVEARFTLVIGLGSNSGKMSTCLGQIYHENKQNLDSGYAKFETFPIWNLPLKHPVNLAYEAATADIKDVNMYDPYHKSAYNINAVNYNRDVEAFPILREIIEKITRKGNFMQTYKSPTDMGINTAKSAIIGKKAVIDASIGEIENRIKRYKLSRKTRSKFWARKCERYLEEAKEFKLQSRKGH